jgi:hypothetical protein
VHVWTSTNPILGFFFINCTHSKIIQHPNKKIFKINYIFIDIKWLIFFVKMWYSSHNTTKCKYTPKTIQMIIKPHEILNHILNMKWINSIWKVPLMWFHKKTSRWSFYSSKCKYVKKTFIVEILFSFEKEQKLWKNGLKKISYMYFSKC